jgi:hypothetical protein
MRYSLHTDDSDPYTLFTVFPRVATLSKMNLARDQFKLRAFLLPHHHARVTSPSHLPTPQLQPQPPASSPNISCCFQWRLPLPPDDPSLCLLFSYQERYKNTLLSCFCGYPPVPWLTGQLGSGHSVLLSLWCMPTPWKRFMKICLCGPYLMARCHHYSLLLLMFMIRYRGIQL